LPRIAEVRERNYIEHGPGAESRASLRVLSELYPERLFLEFGETMMNSMLAAPLEAYAVADLVRVYGPEGGAETHNARYNTLLESVRRYQPVVQPAGGIFQRGWPQHDYWFMNIID
jgi:hypothetical protein